MKIVENKANTPVSIEAENELFVFRLERSETEYSIPLIQDLPLKKIRKLSKLDGEESIDVLIDLFDELAPGLTDVATQRDIALIMEKWSDASNVSLGE